MIIYNKNKMILNTENISVISIEQENSGYKLVAYHGNSGYIMERSKNPDVLTKAYSCTIVLLLSIATNNRECVG